LYEIVQKFLPDEALIGLLHYVLPSQKLPGLRQGGSLSPLFMNLYLHYFLDRPWRRDNAALPLIRVADDLLVLCRTRKQAQQAHDELYRLLLPTGLALKETAESAVHDLKAGESARWLGFVIRKHKQALHLDIDDRSWDRLEKYLALAHTKSDAPLRAIRTIKQWLGQRGPSFLCSDRKEVCQRISKLAAAQAFDEIPQPKELEKLWQTAYARWCRLCESVSTDASCPGRCSRQPRV
jgi:hypothetical protein